MPVKHRLLLQTPAALVLDAVQRFSHLAAGDRQLSCVPLVVLDGNHIHLTLLRRSARKFNYLCTGFPIGGIFLPNSCTLLRGVEEYKIC